MISTSDDAAYQCKTLNENLTSSGYGSLYEGAFDMKERNVSGITAVEYDQYYDDKEKIIVRQIFFQSMCKTYWIQYGYFQGFPTHVETYDLIRDSFLLIHE
jgi:hypothetical protein